MTEQCSCISVALLTESVDWNNKERRWMSCRQVALLTESVDWNRKIWDLKQVSTRRSPHGERGLKSTLHHKELRRALVALLTESVDWNKVKMSMVSKKVNVALLTESVDWNCVSGIFNTHTKQSLSSRRAWIEISAIKKKSSKVVSLSSRRAWIEIVLASCNIWCCVVALLTESVDWNGYYLKV